MKNTTVVQGKAYTVFLSILTISLGILLNGCDNRDNRDMPATTTGSSSTTKISDSDLESSIKAKLNSDAQLKAANLGVSTNAARAEATISGTVETAALHAKAIDLAKSAHSPLAIIDKVEVKSQTLTRAEWTEDKASATRTQAKSYGDSIGNSLDDAWIHTKIVTQLIGNSNTPERKINVDVNNNMVTLRGTVETIIEKNEAEKVAKETEGVKRVTNQIKVNTGKTTSPSPRTGKT